MKYILDGVFVFRTDDGSIWSIDNEDNKITLSPIISRLLLLLLEEQGNILTRDEILRQVWTVYGLEPSGNSLNQYISNIRKNMSLLGLHESAIRTLPKIGFMLDQNIVIVKLDSSDIESKSQKNNFLKLNLTKSRLNYLMLAIIVFTLVASFVAKQEGIFSSHFSVTEHVTLGTINGCKLYGIKNNTISKDDILSLAQEVFDDYNLACQHSNDVALFSVHGGISHGNAGRTFIALCKEVNKSLTSCKNQSFNNW